jgi:hypothetical protein
MCTSFDSERIIEQLLKVLKRMYTTLLACVRCAASAIVK